MTLTEHKLAQVKESIRDPIAWRMFDELVRMIDTADMEWSDHDRILQLLCEFMETIGGSR